VKKVLVSWIGNTDLRAPHESATVGLGPVAQALKELPSDEAFLLSDYSRERAAPYIRWLTDQTPARLEVLYERLSGPTQFREIYEAAVRACRKAVGADKDSTSLAFHLSPGTPAMAAVWIILSKTRFPAELIESSREHGVQTVSVPLDISADFIPDLLRAPDKELERLSAGLSADAPEFADIVQVSRAMQRVILRARRAAPRSIPVLIEGATGTGKELLARAIHQASPRREKPFVGVNCGAIPHELVESELYGHERGAFTGATTQRPGHFREADGGTLFLDELAELPLSAQVKLLRALQEHEVLSVGSSRAHRVDVRLIAATNRPLAEKVTSGEFREDLFHRLAVAILRIPPLRERQEDLPVLVDALLKQVNREGAEQPGYVDKDLSVGARKLLVSYAWPGNVRELLNTLRRATLWSSEPTLTVEDIRDALVHIGQTDQQGVLGRPLGKGLDLPQILADVASHYLARALDEAHGNKTKAAELVGLPSYQTLTNWLRRYGVKG